MEDKTHKQPLEIPGRKSFERGVGHSEDREIDSCWGTGDTFLDVPSLGDIHHFLQERPSLKSLLFPPAPLCSWDCKSKVQFIEILDSGADEGETHSWFNLRDSPFEGEDV